MAIMETMATMAKKKPHISTADIERFRAKYASVANWINKASRSQYTTVNYIRGLIDYCGWSRLNPDELLAEHRRDKAEGTHRAEQRLDRFVTESDLSHNLKWRIVSAVKSFYKSNYEDLSHGCGRISMLRQKALRKPDTHDIELMVRDAPLRDKVVLLVLRDTGMREGSAAKLRWSHVWSELFDSKSGDLIWDHMSPILIRLTSKDLKGRYPENQQICFLTPQTVELLLDCKNSLELRQERLIKPDEPIFVSDHRLNGHFEPIGVKGIAYVVRSAAKRIGKNFSPHDLRRFNQTALEDADIPPNWTRKMLGRRVRSDEDPYSLPKIEQLRRRFVTVIPFLAPEMKVTVEMVHIRLEMLRDFAKSVGIDPTKVIVQDHRWMTKDELKALSDKGIHPYPVAFTGERKPTPEEEIKILQDAIANKFKVRDLDTGEVFDEKTGEVMTVEEYEAKRQRLKHLKAAKNKTD